MNSCRSAATEQCRRARHATTGAGVTPAHGGRRRATTAKATGAMASIRSTTSSTPTRATSSSRSTATAATASCGRSSACRAASTTRRREQELQRTAAHAEVPVQRRAARSGDDVRARSGERSPGDEVHLSAESAPAGDRRRPAGAREVQLRRLPYAEHGAVGLAFAPNQFEAPPTTNDFPFLHAEVRRSKSPRRWRPIVAACCTPICTACRSEMKTRASRGWSTRSRADRAGREGVAAVLRVHAVSSHALINGEAADGRRPDAADSRQMDGK